MSIVFLSTQFGVPFRYPAICPFLSIKGFSWLLILYHIVSVREEKDREWETQYDASYYTSFFILCLCLAVTSIVPIRDISLILNYYSIYSRFWKSRIPARTADKLFLWWNYSIPYSYLCLFYFKIYRLIRFN